MSEKPKGQNYVEFTAAGENSGKAGNKRDFLIPPWEAQQVGSRPEEEWQGGLDFFISYTADDLEPAIWIAECLQAEGYSVSYQHKDFAPGDRFQRDALGNRRSQRPGLRAGSLRGFVCSRGSDRTDNQSWQVPEYLEETGRRLVAFGDQHLELGPAAS